MKLKNSFILRTGLIDVRKKTQKKKEKQDKKNVKDKGTGEQFGKMNEGRKENFSLFPFLSFFGYSIFFFPLSFHFFSSNFLSFPLS